VPGEILNHFVLKNGQKVPVKLRRVTREEVQRRLDAEDEAGSAPAVARPESESSAP
jgi:hypothetical protein